MKGRGLKERGTHEASEKNSCFRGEAILYILIKDFTWNNMHR